jgi:hypothetical protein
MPQPHPTCPVTPTVERPFEAAMPAFVPAFRGLNAYGNGCPFRKAYSTS